MKRGEIYLANLDDPDDPPHGSEQTGKRPVLIIQTNYLNILTTLNTTVIVPLSTKFTTKHIKFPSNVFFKKGEANLNEDSLAKCHQVRVIDRSRLIHKIGDVSEIKINDIEAALVFVLAFPAR